MHINVKKYFPFLYTIIDKGPKRMITLITKKRKNRKERRMKAPTIIIKTEIPDKLQTTHKQNDIIYYLCY